MSLTLTLYKISKKLKSTKVPALTDPHIDLTVTLKDDTDVINPTFRLSTPATLGAIPYNYASIHLWGHTRYYRIRNLELRNDAVVAVHCVEDFLASWATDVKTSSQYVLRSSDTAICDLDVPDASYVGKGDIRVIHTPSTGPDQMLPNPIDGCYIIGFTADVSVTTLHRGAVAYLGFWAADMMNLLQKLSAVTLTAADANPIAYIASCMYIPFDTNNAMFGTHVAGTGVIKMSNSIQLTGLSFYPIDDSAVAAVGLYNFFNKTNIQLPDHPQLTRGKFLNNSPYSYHHLYAGLFGDFDIKQDIIRRDSDGKRYINVSASFDICNGEGIFIVYGNAGEALYKVSAQIGIPIELSQKSFASMQQMFALGMQVADIGESALNTVMAIGGGSDNLGGIISNTFSLGKNVANAIFSAYQATIPKLSTLGNNGGMAALYMDGFQLISTFVRLSDEDLDHIGRPVMQNVSLATVAAGSLVICADTHMVIPALQEEIQMLEADMNGGFYLD
jgi:hypothetical protein